MDFKEWEATVESEYTVEYGRDGIRDIYPTPFSIKLHHEVSMPRHIYVKQSEQTLVDVMVHSSKEEYLKREFGIYRLDYDRYTEEDYGYPIFFGEGSLEKAFEFAMKFNKEVLPNIQ